MVLFDDQSWSNKELPLRKKIKNRNSLRNIAGTKLTIFADDAGLMTRSNKYTSPAIAKL